MHGTDLSNSPQEPGWTNGAVFILARSKKNACMLVVWEPMCIPCERGSHGGSYDGQKLAWERLAQFAGNPLCRSYQTLELNNGKCFSQLLEILPIQDSPLMWLEGFAKFGCSKNEVIMQFHIYLETDYWWEEVLLIWEKPWFVWLYHRPSVLLSSPRSTGLPQAPEEGFLDRSQQQ